MKEIAPNIFIETSFPGVTLGLLNFEHGLEKIDDPFRLDDMCQWKNEMQSITHGTL